MQGPRAGHARCSTDEQGTAIQIEQAVAKPRSKGTLCGRQLKRWAFVQCAIRSRCVIGEVSLAALAECSVGRYVTHRVIHRPPDELLNAQGRVG